MLDVHVIKTVNKILDILIPDIISEFLHSSLLRHCSKPHHSHTTNPRYTVAFPAQMRWRYHNLALRQRNALNSATYHRKQCDEQAVLHKRTRRIAAVAWQRLYLRERIFAYGQIPAYFIRNCLRTPGMWIYEHCINTTCDFVQYSFVVIGTAAGW